MRGPTLRNMAAILVMLAGVLGGPIGPLAVHAQAVAPADAPSGSPVDPAAGPAAADAPTPAATIDYDEWEAVAEGAERLIEDGTAATVVLQTQRNDLARWRAQFLAADTANSERTATIQAQIDALGPAPAEGESEPDPIAERRAILQDRLAEAQVPRLRANEGYNRANGLIAEIDAILSERQTEALLELEPSPLNPVNWASALRALANVVVAIRADITERMADPDIRASMTDNGPALLGLIVVGLFIILRARTWVARLGERFLDSDGRRGRTALGFVVSLGQLILPVLGFSLFVLAFVVSDLPSTQTTTILSAALTLIVAVYAAMWLAGRLFPDHEDRPAAFDATPGQRTVARWVIFLIGLLTGLGNFMEIVAGLDIVPPAARGVLVVPVHIGLGLCYLRLAGLFRRFRDSNAAAERSGIAQRVLGPLTTAISVIAVVGPALGIVGYVNAAEALMVPTAQTLFILGLLVALHSVTRDLYAVAFRATSQAASDALLPVLVNLALSMVALPVLALVWGMRTERLGDLYNRALEGFTLGATRVTPGTVLAVILMFGLGILVTRLLQGALKSTILPRTSLDVGARNAVTAGVGYVGIALAALIAVTSAGIDLTALGFVLGALSVGIGFGLQNVVSNFVSGIILLIERPISEGDWIEVNGNMGIVKGISVRSTRIETFDKTDLIVPNADFISGTVTNWTRGNTIGRVMLNVGVAYGTDTRRVAAILQEIAEGHPDVSRFPEPGVDFMGFGADSLDFRVRVILKDINLFIKVQTELYHQIAERFVAEGIEIPFAQRDIWLRNPEALRTSATPDTMPSPDSAKDA